MAARRRRNVPSRLSAAARDAPRAVTRRAPAPLADLRARLISGAALAAAAAVALWVGGWVSALFVAAAAAAMAWELKSVVARASGGPRPVDLVYPALAAAAAILAHLDAITDGPILAEIPGAGAVALWVLAGVAGAAPAPGDLWAPFRLLEIAVLLVLIVDRRGWRDWIFTLPGLVLIAGAAAAFVWLRDQPRFGFEATIWLVVVVAAVDIGGYFAGRLIGGPRLAPTLSPNKTWSGLFGGLALAFGVGALFSWATTGTYAVEVCTVSLLTGLVAQAGDISESGFKRQFRVKDAGRLIPGHGGALDRLDGLLAATLVAATVTAARGQEVFVW